MARSGKKTRAAKRVSSESKITVDRGQKTSGNFLDKIQNDLEKNQSYLNLILGALIIIVLGVLIFNYFNKPTEEPGDIGPSQQVTDEQGDVTRESLPGKYTVKKGDTLFLIAQKYYNDGEKYPMIMSENNLKSDSIEAGQELTIPKVEVAESPSPASQIESSPSSTAKPEESISPSMNPSAVPAPAGEKGGALNQTTWGENISTTTYTVVAGDWLSKIAGRAYGDIMQYEKIAKANNISDPNSIEVGTVLKIPRD